VNDATEAAKGNTTHVMRLTAYQAGFIRGLLEVEAGRHRRDAAMCDRLGESMRAEQSRFWASVVESMLAALVVA
jgi:hypothetical protein